MNSFKEKMHEKIKIYSDKEYLKGYIKNEFLTEDGDADIYLNINDKNELFDSKSYGDQIDLLPSIYEFIENKSSMLDNDIPLNIHIIGVDLDSREQGMIKHIFKEHYAIELYKVQKNYIQCRNKIIGLVLFGIITFIAYFSLYTFTNLNFIFEVMGFLVSFAIVESSDSYIYKLQEIKHKRESITQTLLMNISFE